MKKFIYFLLIIFTCSAASPTFAQVLSVTQTIQEHSNWCWDASSKCILDYYGFTPSQCNIANWAWSSSNCCGNSTFNWSHPCNSANNLYGSAGSAQDILDHFGNIQSTAIASSLTQSTIQSEISSGRPFAFRWGWSSGGGHMLVGHGISGNTIYYMDPWPGNGLSFGSYSWMVNDGNHTWTHTLKMNSSGCPQPSNDGCMGSFTATYLNFSSSCNYISATTCGATSSGFSSCVGTGDDDVFFYFIPTSSSATITVVGGSGNDMVFQALTGPCGGNMIQLACVDNTGTGGTEMTTVNGLTPGIVYFIRVYEYYSGYGATGNFQICVTGQSGCTNYASSPSSNTFNSSGGNGSFVVSATGSSCYYSAESNNSWISNVVAGSGGVVTYNVDAWTGCNSRTGTISVKDGDGVIQPSATFTITQNGLTVPNTPGAISGNTSVCPGQTYTYNVPYVSGVTYLWNVSNGNTNGSTSNSVQVTWGSAGNGILSVYGQNNCGQSYNSSQQFVTINPIPSVSAWANPSVVCVNNPVAFSANGATTYQWNGYPISGQNGSYVTGSFTFPGTYTVTVTGSQNGCNGTATASVTVSACTGIEDLNNGVSFDLHPNPVQDILTIVGSGLSNGDYNIILVNALGEKIQETQIPSHKGSIEFLLKMSDRPVGLYLLIIRSDKVNRVFKVIRQD